LARNACKTAGIFSLFAPYTGFLGRKDALLQEFVIKGVSARPKPAEMQEFPSD
jgi:hypothetical protein